VVWLDRLVEVTCLPQSDRCQRHRSVGGGHDLELDEVGGPIRSDPLPWWAPWRRSLRVTACRPGFATSSADEFPVGSWWWRRHSLLGAGHDASLRLANKLAKPLLWIQQHRHVVDRRTVAEIGVGAGLSEVGVEMTVHEHEFRVLGVIAEQQRRVAGGHRLRRVDTSPSSLVTRRLGTLPDTARLTCITVTLRMASAACLSRVAASPVVAEVPGDWLAPVPDLPEQPPIASTTKARRPLRRQQCEAEASSTSP